MRKFFGGTVILCCLALLFFLIKEVQTEMNQTEKKQQAIEQAMVLPQISTTLPVTLLDRNEKVFSEEYTDWSEPLSLEQIPEIAQQLFIVSEDEDFYTHKGFDVSAIARAIAINSSEQASMQGGSTITQQLVRMRYLTNEKSYERKLTELFFAYELEQKYDKEEILEMYLNEMYFSNQVYGIGAAASYYFNKPLADLSVAQLAFIAAIPNNPSLYNPLKNFENTKARQERLLKQLFNKGFITEEQLRQFSAEKITLNIKTKAQDFPAYSTYVMQELRWLVAEKEGIAEALNKDISKEEKEQLTLELNGLIERLFEQNITIYTALNPAKQALDEQNIDAILGNGELQGSATTIDNSTREIISIYAGHDYKKLDLHRAYQLPRQPGSSFKPLAVYAPYLNATGVSTESIVSGGAYCVGNFCPQNYGGFVYGNVTLATAFKNSLNTSALRLFYTVGVDESFKYLQKFQFRSLVEKDQDYAASLGGLTYGVTSLELADAYSSFIDGYYLPTHSIRKVTNAAGEVLYSWEDEAEVIWSPRTTEAMRSLLHEVVVSGTGIGISNHGNYIGAKTGTTNDYRDFWVAGLNNNYTTAVWIGYDKARSMQALENDKIHFKIFNSIMNN